MRVLPVLLLLAAQSDSTGTLMGRVVLSSDRSPASFANVIVVGTRRGAQAGEDGRFQITGIPPGRQSLRILLVGHPAKSESFDVRAGFDPVEHEIVLETPQKPDPIRIGAQSKIRSGDLEATIRPAARFQVGDKASFDVRIRNRSKETVLLVTSVDGSDAWASPEVKIAIEGPPEGWKVRPSLRCGNTNGVSYDDFIEVAPGESFNPYVHGWIGANLRRGTFQKPGRYTATFRYITTETDPRLWMSGPCVDCPVPDSFREMLERVPAVELTATTSFEVEP